MTKERKIKNQYRLLGLAINWRGPDKHNRLKCVRRHLDAIKDLMLEPEPGTLASSVIRLTDELNESETRVRKLEEELDLAIQSNAFLRERLSFAESSLRGCRAAEEVLKKKVTRHERYTEARKEHIEILNKDIDTVTQGNVELMEEILKQNKYIEILKKDRRAMLEQGYSIPSKLLEENRKLNREYALQKKYVEILEREARNYSRRLTWWSKLQAKK